MSKHKIDTDEWDQGLVQKAVQVCFMLGNRYDAAVTKCPICKGPLLDHKLDCPMPLALEVRAAAES